MLPLVLLLGLAQQAAADLSCRPQGPIVPPPRDLNSSPTFRRATDQLAQAFNRAVNGSIHAGWAVENGSFSVALVSVGQRDPKVPLWEYHHLASNNVRGTRRLGRDSQYLIGSISKVMTDAVAIRSGVRMDDAVTKYLPGLSSSPSSPVSWDNITLRHLASQLSGLPPNCKRLDSDSVCAVDCNLRSSDLVPSVCNRQTAFPSSTSSSPTSSPWASPPSTTPTSLLAGSLA